MGNRAVITGYRGIEDTYKSYENNNVGIYLHWNGGRDSIEAFLLYNKMQGNGSIEQGDYAIASLTNIITNFFNNSGSCGVDVLNRLDCDNWDNGVYVVQDHRIIGRRYFKGTEQQNYDLYEMLYEIDKHQPDFVRFGKDIIDMRYVNYKDLKVGDIVIKNIYGKSLNKWSKFEIKSINEEGYPVIDLYEGNNDNNIIGKYEEVVLAIVK